MKSNVEEEKSSSDLRKIRKSLRFLPLKFIHIFFSLVLTAYGVGIFLLTLTVRTQLSGYMEFIEYYMDKPVIVLIIGSIIQVGLGCLGLVTVLKNIYQGIVTFGVLVFGLFMLKFTLGAVALATLGSADLSLTHALEFHINNYTNNTVPMDYIQTELNCCGITDFTDWNSTLGYVPGSCCDSDSACGFADILSLNEIGCYGALKSLINYLMIYLAMILGVLAIVQIIAMTITFFLARGIANIRRRVSALSIESDEEDRSSVTAKPEPAPAPIQNPLGVRRLVPLKDNEKSSTTNPYLVKIFGENPLPGQVSVPIRRDSFLRHPVNDNVSFGYGHNSSHRIITPTAPPLPVTNRRFPIGF